ncbi:MAG: DUF202 domain-containing protein [Actinomycetota bacterium]|nr:DUF202 domain-containing protein [Actinomycetota bacterium]
MSERPPAAPPDLDPDVRFLLANERTLLAWLRTGLAVQAGGLAVLQFATALDRRTALGLAVLALGILCVIGGWWRHRQADRAIRTGRLPARGVVPDLVVLGTVALSLLLAVAFLRS